MGHYLVRATILPEIVKNISVRYNINEKKALGLFYKSRVGNCFSDDETGLYGQSPLYIFSMFVDEQGDSLYS